MWSQNQKNKPIIKDWSDQYSELNTESSIQVAWVSGEGVVLRINHERYNA